VVWDNEDGRFDSCGMFSGIVLCREEMGLLWGEEKRWLLLWWWRLQIGKTWGLWVGCFFVFLFFV